MPEFSFPQCLLPVISFSFSILFPFCFCCPASLTFSSAPFCGSFSLCLCHCFSFCLFPIFLCYFWILSVCFSVSLPLFLVPSLTVLLSCASVCVCLFSWCLKLPLLQSGCWDSGPKLPASGPRPFHFLNPLQLVSGGKQDAGKTGRRWTPGVWASGLSALPVLKQ